MLEPSLCNLRVLCVSVVKGKRKSSPQRHREHGDHTEMVRGVWVSNEQVVNANKFLDSDWFTRRGELA
jgi:hypothetical protein